MFCVSLQNTSKDLFLLLICFVYFIIKLYNIVLVLPNIEYTCIPHPEPSSLLPPPTIPLGCPSAPGRWTTSPPKSGLLYKPVEEDILKQGNQLEAVLKPDHTGKFSVC